MAHGIAADTSQGVSVRMPAKVNLHLGVHAGRNEHGYHHVDTIMVPVGVYDVVTVRHAQKMTIAYDPPITVRPMASALGRAVVALGKALGTVPALGITVRRGIPSEGGLGSASADVAAAIHACCRLWGICKDEPAVRDVARAVGADVTFFLDPVPSLLTGIGNELQETYPPLDAPMVLVKPQGGVSTAAAYAEFDRHPTPCVSPTPLSQELATGNAAAVATCLHNNLADAAIRLVPAIGAVRAWLRMRPGVTGAQVTGSGSCVFALCETDDDAQAIAADARRANLWATATRTSATMDVTVDDGTPQGLLHDQEPPAALGRYDMF